MIEPLLHESDFSIEEEQDKNGEKKKFQTKGKKMSFDEKSISEWTH